MRDLPAFRIEVYFTRWEFHARHHLTASDAETLTVGELLTLASEEERQAFEDLALRYVPTWGGDALREAIANTYKGIGPEHVLTFAGAEEALFWALSELTGAGGHVIVTVPNYQSTETIPLAAGARVDALVLDPAAGWTIDLDRLERLLRPETTLVVANFPNNPTGALPDRETFVRLVELCDAHGVRLLSDEVHRGLELDSAQTLPQAASLSPSAVSLNVMSKSFGLPGLRIGWLASRDRQLLERLERRKHYTSICNAAPSEALATIALRNGERIIGRNRAIVEENLELFADFFSEHADRFVWEPPQGGCVCFPRYLGTDVEDFCRRLVEQEGVLLLPASIFASELAAVPSDRFRIGVGRRNPGPALDAFGRFLTRG